MKDIISVIVPVHNVEDYLCECLDSIINQTYKCLEIILVDDNSTDNSGIICDEYAQKDSRVSVLHITCGGEGGAVARNTGIGIATGKYFYFMDSDDYIEQNMLAEMYDILCKERSQCVVCSFHYVNEIKKELPWRTPQLTDYHTMSGIQAAQVFLTSLDIEGFSWNKMFLREVIMDYNIRFDEDMNSFVDMHGMFRGILYSEKVSFCDKQLYYYRQRQASCVHTMSLRKLDNYRRVINLILEDARKNNLKEESEFFYTYRMMLQLFDAFKNKRKYNKQEWLQIKKKYNWTKTFGSTFWKTEKELLRFLREHKIKNSVKLFLIWRHFMLE